MLKKSKQEVFEPIQLAHEADIRIGDAWLRPAARALEFDGRRELLEPRVAQVLVALAKRPGEVVGRDDLVDMCWSGRIVGEDAINRCIAKARRAASGAGFEIETIPRVGYRLVALGPAVRRRGAQWSRLFAASGILVCFIIAAFLWTNRPAPTRPNYPPIAIGEFTVRAESPILRARTAEITSQLVDALIKVGVPVLRTTDRGLNQARYLVQGQITSTRDTVNALIQMDDTITKNTIVSLELELDWDEVPLLADKVAAAVADAVTRTGAYYALTATSTDPDETTAFLNVVLQIASGSYLEAELRAQRLLERQPSSRLAPFAMSFATIYALPLLPLDERPDAIARGRAAARLARRRLPDFGDVYIADCKLYPTDYSACEKTVRRALVIDPHAPTLRTQLALQLMDGGRLEEALPLTARALAENPFNPSKVLQRLYLTELMGLESEQKYIRDYGQRYWPKLRFARQHFVSLMAGGRWADAEAKLPLVLRIEPGSAERLKTIFAALRQPTDAAKDKTQLACNGEMESAASVACFTGLSMLGRTEAAAEAASRFYPVLEAASPAEKEALFVRNGSDPGPLFLVWGNGAKAMRKDPAFAMLARQVGLIRYWKQSGPPDFCKRELAPVCKLI